MKQTHEAIPSREAIIHASDAALATARAIRNLCDNVSRWVPPDSAFRGETVLIGFVDLHFKGKALDKALAPVAEGINGLRHGSFPPRYASAHRAAEELALEAEHLIMRRMTFRGYKGCRVDEGWVRLRNTVRDYLDGMGLPHTTRRRPGVTVLDYTRLPRATQPRPGVIVLDYSKPQLEWTDDVRTLRQNLDGIAITVAKPTGCNPWA
jgi:hypothetical protein